jgi:FMN phosphatase YigB (HAD superfamily)
MDFLRASPPRGIIFDLGDVLFTWSANTSTTIPAPILKDILSTPVWHSYERGEITRNAYYELSARQFSIPASEIAEAFLQAHTSVQPDHAIISLLRELKNDGTIQVYAMSNMGKEDFEELAKKLTGHFSIKCSPHQQQPKKARAGILPLCSSPDRLSWQPGDFR